MTRPFSLAFKQKMVERLTGKDAMNPWQLARERGLRQQSLSRWFQEARSIPRVGSDKRIERKWTVEQKARIVADAFKLTGRQLSAYLEQEGVQLAHLERWRLALAEDGQAPIATTKHIRKLERELALTLDFTFARLSAGSAPDLAGEKLVLASLRGNYPGPN